MNQADNMIKIKPDTKVAYDGMRKNYLIVHVK